MICMKLGAPAYVGCFLTWGGSLESCWMPAGLPWNSLALAFQRKSLSESICKVGYRDLELPQISHLSSSSSGYFPIQKRRVILDFIFIDLNSLLFLSFTRTCLPAKPLLS